MWKDYQTAEQSHPSIPEVLKTPEKGLIRTLLRRKVSKISGRDPNLVAEEYVSWQQPQLIVAAHKFEDALQRKYQRVNCILLMCLIIDIFTM